MYNVMVQVTAHMDAVKIGQADTMDDARKMVDAHAAKTFIDTEVFDEVAYNGSFAANKKVMLAVAYGPGIGYTVEMA